MKKSEWFIWLFLVLSIFYIAFHVIVDLFIGRVA
jgi:hypothetical protein